MTGGGRSECAPLGGGGRPERERSARPGGSHRPPRPVRLDGQPGLYRPQAEPGASPTSGRSTSARSRTYPRLGSSLWGIESSMAGSAFASRCSSHPTSSQTSESSRLWLRYTMLRRWRRSRTSAEPSLECPTWPSSIPASTPRCPRRLSKTLSLGAGGSNMASASSVFTASRWSGRSVGQLRSSVLTCRKWWCVTWAADVRITGVLDGRSVDTTMGFTPMEGVPMVSRSGSIDPGIVFHLLRADLMEPDEIEHALE